MFLKQFSIYEFDLSIDTYSALDDTVYAVVLSPNEMNDCLKSVLIAPLCNECSITPTTFLIDDVTRVKLDQIATVDKACVVKYVDKISFQKVKKIRDILEEMFIRE